MSDDNWSDRSPSERARQAEPSPATPESELLATLRAQPGRWYRYAANTGFGWWFSWEAKVLTGLAHRDLLVYEQEHTRGFRADVWAKALTPDERASIQDVRAST